MVDRTHGQAEVAAFFEAHAADFEKNGRKIKNVLENINTNCAYLEKFKASKALEWLEAYKPK